MNCVLLPPTNEACVKNSVHRGWGVCLIACWDTPRDHRQAQPSPRGQRQAPPRADNPPPPPGTVHAVRYGQQVGGTHPTGMQSCLLKWIKFTVKNN